MSVCGKLDPVNFEERLVAVVVVLMMVIMVVVVAVGLAVVRSMRWQ